MSMASVWRFHSPGIVEGGGGGDGGPDHPVGSIRYLARDTQSPCPDRHQGAEVGGGPGREAGQSDQRGCHPVYGSIHSCRVRVGIMIGFAEQEDGLWEQCTI